MKRFFLFRVMLVAAVATMLCGCNRAKIKERIMEKVRVESIEHLSGSLAEGWVITLRATNKTGYTMSLSSGEGDIYYNGRRIARVKLLDKVTLPKHTEGAAIDVPVALSLSSPLRALALWKAVRSGAYDGIDITFNGEVRVAGLSRRVAFERVPLKSILQRLGYKK